MKRILSKYVSEYEMNDGTIGLLNSVFLTKKFIDKRSWNKVKNSSDFSEIPAEVIDNLQDGKILIEEGEDNKRLNDLRAGMAMRPSVKVMYLFVSNTCNMRCRYCVIDKEAAQTQTGGLMTQKTVDRAINLFLRNAETERPAILLWGGEPLSNWVVFKYAVERARALEKKYSKRLDISTVTNGTLMTKEIAAFLKKNAVTCSISMDGLKDQHDKMRIYADGRGTYGDIRTNLKLLEEAGVEFGISLAIGSHNVDLLPTVGPELCKDLEIKRMGCCLLMNVDKANPAYTDDERIARQLIELFKKLCEEGIFEDTMIKKIKPFVFNEEHLHDCAAGGRQIAVMPNGDIGICHYAATSGRWVIGNVKDPAEKVFCSKVLAEWANRSPINMPQCKECPGLIMCGGGCPYEAYQKKGDIWALDDRFCTHCKESIKWMMEALYKGRSSDGEKSLVLNKMAEVVDRGRFIRRFMPGLQKGVARVSEKDLQQGADLFRRSNRLTSAKATEEWMFRNGITMEFFDEFLVCSILFSRYKDQLEKNPD